jgi:mannose-1-phosphate guanylyltransferase
MGIMDRLAPALYTENETGALAELFPQCEKISIDYAVMEKSDRIRVIAADLAWSDLGSWGSVKGHLPADERANAVVGQDVRLFGAEGNLVHTAGEKTVVIDGLKDYIVAEKDGLLLICPLASEQLIKEYSASK